MYDRQTHRWPTWNHNSTSVARYKIAVRRDGKSPNRTATSRFGVLQKKVRVVSLAWHAYWFSYSSLPNIIKIPLRVSKLQSAQGCSYYGRMDRHRAHNYPSPPPPPPPHTHTHKHIWPRDKTRIPSVRCVACLKRQPLNPSLQTEWNQCIPSKVIEGKQYLYHLFTPTTKTKLKKGHNLAKILRMITNIKLDLYFTMIHVYISFLKLSIKSMHPCKSYWVVTNINTPTKSKSKKGHNSAKILWMITNMELDLYFTMIYPFANLQ